MHSLWNIISSSSRPCYVQVFFLVLQPDDRGGQVDRISWFLPQGICFCKLMSSFPSICCYLAKQDSSVCVILCVVHGLCSIYCHNHICCTVLVVHTWMYSAEQCTTVCLHVLPDIELEMRAVIVHRSIASCHCTSIAACISPKLGFIQNLCLFI